MQQIGGDILMLISSSGDRARMLLKIADENHADADEG
jgi:hypothetical protein